MSIAAAGVELAQSANIARRLRAVAAERPDAVAVITPGGHAGDGQSLYRRFTFRELDEDSDRLAAGLHGMGVEPGTRLALLVRPSFDFISAVFALFKAGAIQILIDPGMGVRNLLGCLDDAQPEGFVAISPVQAVRTVLGRRFAAARWNVTVGRRWFWSGPTFAQFRAVRWPGHQLAPVTADDPAAIIFTTGSTGPPKGVGYSHGNFDNQVEQIRDFYDIQPGEIDLACFPLFGLFNCAMGVTAVVPDMDPTRPAAVDPRKIVRAISDLGVTQAFGSPAVWHRVGPYCRDNGVRLPTLKRVLSAGAPVPARVLETMRAALGPGGDVHTPYGATEALPVASIAATEVLRDTALLTAQGAGICVGRRFSAIDWQVIAIVDGPLASFSDATILGSAEPGSAAVQGGAVGELIVRGPQVTARYVTTPGANARGKIVDPTGNWHRMGDVGYFDPMGRFWFCGRLAHRVTTRRGDMFTIPCEAIANQHPRVARSALVGLGPRGRQRPVLIVEPVPKAWPRRAAWRRTFAAEILALTAVSALTHDVQDVLFHPSFPVDIRHNAKIFREKLAVWAAQKLGLAASTESSP